jgi:hypothetical protein
MDELEGGSPTAKDKAALACAIERLGNRITRLRMQPEPKPIDVQVVDDRRRRRQIAAAAEPDEV